MPSGSWDAWPPILKPSSARTPRSGSTSIASGTNRRYDLANTTSARHDMKQFGQLLRRGSFYALSVGILVVAAAGSPLYAEQKAGDLAQRLHAARSAAISPDQPVPQPAPESSAAPRPAPIA